jgi:hypothetical protein
MKALLALLRITIIVFFLSACAGSKSTIKTYINPSFSRDAIKSLGLLPIRNISMTPSEGMEINRFFYKEVTARNPNKKVVDPLVAVQLINDANLVSTYDQFLREFENTGVPNTNLLKALGKQIGCDAIIQGVVSNVQQIDSKYPSTAAKTSASLRYVIISTTTGDILWEASCASSKTTFTSVAKTPPLFEVLQAAQEKIVTTIPKL